MTVLTFPSNPTNGQRYAAPNGIQYVFDGVKWIVETTTSSSAAITNSTQDRVAPMFVDGDNTGITFTYNAETNVISAEVTAVNGDTLVNGVHELTLESNGNITAPAFTIPNAVGTNGQVLKWPSSGSTLTWAADSNTTTQLVNGDSSFSISSDGTLTLTHPAEPALHPLATVLTVQKAAGNYHTISGAYGLSLQATPVPSGSGLNTNTNFVDIFHDGISVNVDNNTWAFGTDGVLTLPSDGTITSPDDITLLANQHIYISTNHGSKTWDFDGNGKLTLPTNGTISYAPDDTDNWNAPLVNTISAALDELAFRLKAVENIEIEGGNAYAMAGPELILDGNGA